MNFETEEQSLQALFQQLVKTGDTVAMRELLNNQNISDVAQLINDYPDYEAGIIANMSVHRAASVFKILDVSTQKTIIHDLPPFKTAELLNELPADDRADFLEELPQAAIRDLIKMLEPEERKVTLSLLGYPDYSVGRMMTPDYVYVYAYNTVEEAFATIRRFAKNSETIDVIYVIDEKGELVDDIRIRDVIIAAPDKLISDIIDGRVISLNVQDDQDQARQIFKMNNRVALPVTDNKNILLGIVTIDDILWVADEEFSEDLQKIGGTEALEEPYLETPLLKLFRKRVGWLVVLFIGELLTATAMGYFEDEISRALVLALFIPLIISSGGNSGSQASSLIIQSMATGELQITDWWRVMKREIISGLMLGSALGVLGFIRVIIWHMIVPGIYGDHWMLIGFTVGFSLIGVVLWGTFSGSMLPIVLKKLGADPAVSSAPFVATLVDVTGLIIYFSVAYFFLQGLLL